MRTARWAEGFFDNQARGKGQADPTKLGRRRLQRPGPRQFLKWRNCNGTGYHPSEGDATDEGRVAAAVGRGPGTGRGGGGELARPAGDGHTARRGTQPTSVVGAKGGR